MNMLIPLCLVALAVILLIIFLRKNYGTLEKGGFPVIPPFFCFGSGPFLFHKFNFMKLDYERFEKHGKIYGAYIMSTPWVFTSDPDIIKQITIKDFDHFHGHMAEFPEQKYRSLDTTAGEEWREIRKGLSPIFTSGKIKGMTSMVNWGVDNMLDYLEKKVEENPVVDMKPVFQSMTMDVIGKVAFGIDLNCFNDPDTPLFKYARQVFADFLCTGLKSDFLSNMEFGMIGLEKLFYYVPPSLDYVWKITRKIQDDRAKENVVIGDFIGKIIEMKHLIKNGHVTEDQLTAQGGLFLGAGFETIATTLGTLSYNLVKNPQALEILMGEVDTVLEDHEGVVNHETITKMPYLEANIKETLRLFPTIARNDRMCNKDWEYKGYKIKKGTCVGISHYVIHHNPEYWPEPELYKPERFLKDNATSIPQGAFMPFGTGPRTCIGERFALMEIKIAMTRLLQKYNIEMADSTRMILNNGDMFMLSYPDINIKLVPRE